MNRKSEKLGLGNPRRRHQGNTRRSHRTEQTQESKVKMEGDGKKVYTDEEVFTQIKDKSRQAYMKSWKEFKMFNIGHDFEEDHPGEEAIIAYFNHLRLEKRMATSSIWTYYSYINSVMKRKYGWQLQSLPRITMVIKGYEEDTKHKAAIFEEEVSNFRAFVY